MPKRIQRKRTKGWRMPEGAVYVGRPTKWGNPYSLDRISAYEYVALDPEGNEIPESWGGRNHAAGYVVDQYREALTHGGLADPWLIRDIGELAGHDLACWCPLDQPCHADVLLEIANMGRED